MSNSKEERKRIIGESRLKSKELKKAFPYKSWTEFKKKNELRAHQQLAGLSINNEMPIEQASQKVTPQYSNTR